MRSTSFLVLGAAVALVGSGLVAAESPASAAGANGVVIQSIAGAPFPGFFLAGNGPAGHPAMSTDGRFVVFESDDDGWDTNDTNISTDIYLRDNLLGTVRRITAKRADGTEPDDNSFSPTMSWDGRYIGFVTNADGFTSSDTNLSGDAYRYDVVAKTFTRASFTNFGSGGNGQDDGFDYVTDAVISPDGSHLAFTTDNGMTPVDQNGANDVYLRDFATTAPARLTAGNGGPAGGGGENPSVSLLGCEVGFDSDAVDIIQNDANNATDVFVSRRCPVLTARTRISAASNGGASNGPSNTPKLSATGRYVAFLSKATNLAASGPNGDGTKWQLFVRDRDTDADGVLDEVGTMVTTMVSQSSGTAANADVTSPAISPDGCQIAFTTSATNLAGAGGTDVFVANRCPVSNPVRVSTSTNGAPTNGSSYNTVLSPDGDQVAFQSGATNVFTGDANNSIDVFAKLVRNDSAAPIITNSWLSIPSNSVWIAATGTNNVQPSWGGWDPSGVHDYTISLGRYAWNKGSTPASYSPFYNATTNTSSAFTSASYGTTYCLRISAESDNVGHSTTGVGATTCRALPLLSSAFTYSSGWTSYAPGSGAYGGTVRRTATRGATATRAGILAERVAVLFTTCPTCGTADVLWNGSVLKHVSLVSATTKRNVAVHIAAWPTPRSGTLAVKVTSTGKPVVVEGLGVFTDG